MPHLIEGKGELHGHKRQCTLEIKMMAVITVDCSLCAKVAVFSPHKSFEGLQVLVCGKTLRSSEKEQDNGELTSR